MDGKGRTSFFNIRSRLEEMDLDSGKGKKMRREKEEEGMSERKNGRREEWRERRRRASRERTVS